MSELESYLFFPLSFFRIGRPLELEQTFSMYGQSFPDVLWINGTFFGWRVRIPLICLTHIFLSVGFFFFRAEKNLSLIPSLFSRRPPSLPLGILARFQNIESFLPFFQQSSKPFLSPTYLLGNSVAFHFGRVGLYLLPQKPPAPPLSLAAPRKSSFPLPFSFLRILYRAFLRAAASMLSPETDSRFPLIFFLFVEGLRFRASSDEDRRRTNFLVLFFDDKALPPPTL